MRKSREVRGGNRYQQRGEDLFEYAGRGSSEKMIQSMSRRPRGRARLSLEEANLIGGVLRDGSQKVGGLSGNQQSAKRVLSNPGGEEKIE